MRLYLMLISSLLISQGCYAANWLVDTAVHQTISYNDNVTMSEQRSASTIYQLSPMLNVSYKTLNSGIVGTVRYGIQRYFDLPELDSDNQSYGLSANYQTQRLNVELSTKHDIAAARNSAVTDTGNFSTDVTKTKRSVSPSFSYKVTELDHLNLSASYTDTSYSSSGFSDNTNKSINVSWQQQWSERYSWTIGLSYSDFNSTGLNQKTSSDTIGLFINTHYSFSENWEMISSTGLRVTSTKTSSQLPTGNFTNKSKSEGFLSDTAFKYNGERTTFAINLNRSLVASGSGQLNEQTQLAVNLSYKVTERLSTDLSTSYQISQSESGNQDNTRKNLNFQLSVSWQVAPNLTLGSRYQYQQQDDSGGNVVDSNNIMLTLSYNWKALNLSR